MDYCSIETVRKRISQTPIEDYILNWWNENDEKTKQKICDEFCFTKRYGYQFHPYQTLSNRDIREIYWNHVRWCRIIFYFRIENTLLIGNLTPTQYV